jgi:hypothetical protein
LNNDDQKYIKLPDVFFDAGRDHWLSKSHLPNSNQLNRFDAQTLPNSPRLVDDSIPILFGEGCSVLTNSQSISLPLDIFGGIFFLLARYEEYLEFEPDDHGRFPATESLAYKAGFLERPIVDEYVEILWACMKTLWAELSRTELTSSTNITCDVDTPYDARAVSFPGTARTVLGDLIKRKSAGDAIASIRRYIGHRTKNFEHDTNYESLRWMMGVNEAAGNVVSFYFIPAASNLKYDMGYSIRDQVVVSMIKEIHARGHLIGIHPSYDSHFSEERIRYEHRLLQSLMNDLDIDQIEVGGRQHYLRWSQATPRYWASSGISYDSTLCFADHAGFRCGTSRAFKMFDLQTSKVLPLTQRPLIAAESVVVSDVYMGLGATTEGLEYFLELKKRCHMFNGCFTLLWHNSTLTTLEEREIYKAIIQ